MQIGIYTFAETTPDVRTGQTVSSAQRLRDLLEEIELADQVGLDVFGVGEHHRPDYAASAPAVVLAAAAARTSRIRLTSAVTVLSSDDPVRVFQDFATLDLLSGGRAEIMAGRGSFIESFPLFGYDLGDYDALFAEKLDLLLRLRATERVTGRARTARRSTGLASTRDPLQHPLPVWIAVGGTPQSVVRAATLGLPMALAIIGGQPERFVPARRALPGGRAPRGPRSGAAPGEHQLARLHRRALAAGRRRRLPPVPGRDGADRARARMAAADAAALRGRARTARRAARRQPAGGDRQDPLGARAVRAPALPPAALGGHDAAREDAARHRAARDRGRARSAARGGRAQRGEPADGASLAGSASGPVGATGA
jgi:alkanesulfonate monooxygenase SsuD/methylene tetrahydromethanopterin reductase-like flavin-dependent oxidoreductase (luciferase family)